MTFIQVPELAGCWLLTILLQLPSSLFLLLNYRATKSMPLEIAMNSVLAVFVICEIIVGAVALKSMVNHQVGDSCLRYISIIHWGILCS